MASPVLTTERLVLRPITVDDAPALQRHFDNWNIVQHLTTAVPWPYPADGAISHITETILPTNEAGTSLTWAITLREDIDELVGCIDFTFADTGLGNRGFWLAEHHWGKGLITETVIAVQDHVLLDLGVERMVVLNSVGNPASRRIKEKTGARLIDQIPVQHHNGETLTDRWEVTRADWAAIRNRAQ